MNYDELLHGLRDPHGVYGYQSQMACEAADAITQLQARVAELTVERDRLKNCISAMEVRALVDERDKLKADLAAARADYEAFANSESTSAQQLREDLVTARALLYRAYPYVEDAQYDSDEMRLAKRTLLYDIDAAIAGEKNDGL